MQSAGVEVNVISHKRQWLVTNHHVPIIALMAPRSDTLFGLGVHCSHVPCKFISYSAMDACTEPVIQPDFYSSTVVAVTWLLAGD